MTANKSNKWTSKTILNTGPHSGKPLDKVPASYLIWINDIIGVDRKSELGVYISENIDAIRERNEHENKLNGE